jgi:glycosyltransferase involved in cell wall biosynthesis
MNQPQHNRVTPMPAGAPKASVIIPSYNSAAFIERALNSVLAQTMDDYEILICDDASTDSTCDMVRSFAQVDSRIKLLRLQENGGAAAARNLGLTAACGEYIAFLDSDDEWLPEKLTRQIALMDSRPPTTGLCLCGADIIRDGDPNRTVHNLPDPAWETDSYRKFVLSQIPFTTSTILFRRSVLALSGPMNPTMRQHEDSDFLGRILEHYDLAAFPEPYVIMHLSTSPSKGVYQRLLHSSQISFAKIPKIRKKLGWWTAVRYRARIRMNLCRVALRERQWTQFSYQLLRRLVAFPLLFPRDLSELAKSFIRAIIR